MQAEKNGDVVLGKVIRSARVEAGLSQSDLEDLSGIPKPRLSRYENGHVSPTIGSLRRIAAGLNTRPSELLLRAGL